MILAMQFLSTAPNALGEVTQKEISWHMEVNLKLSRCRRFFM
jgi:hypothetical protein